MNRKGENIVKYLAIVVIVDILLSLAVGAAVRAYAQEKEKKVFFTIHLMVPKGNKNRENVGMLLAEELFAAGAAISQNRDMLGSIKGEDFMKVVLVAILGVGFILGALNITIIADLLGM